MNVEDMTPEQIQQHAKLHRASYKAAPAKRSGQTPEAKVSKAVNKYLDSLGAINLRTGAGSVEVDGRRIAIGLAGTSDRTLCLPNGMFAAVEIKATTKLSDRQQRYLDRVAALGGVAIVARCVDDVRDALAERFSLDTVEAWEERGKTRKRR